MTLSQIYESRGRYSKGSWYLYFLFLAFRMRKMQSRNIGNLRITAITMNEFINIFCILSIWFGTTHLVLRLVTNGSENFTFDDSEWWRLVGDIESGLGIASLCTLSRSRNSIDTVLLKAARWSSPLNVDIDIDSLDQHSSSSRPCSQTSGPQVVVHHHLGCEICCSSKDRSISATVGDTDVSTKSISRMSLLFRIVKTIVYAAWGLYAIFRVGRFVARRRQMLK